MSLGDLAFSLCLCIYCFEGAGLVLALESSVAEEEDDGGKAFLRCFSLSLAAIAAFYVIFGAVGGAAFGPGAAQMITDNVDSGGVVARTVKVKFGAAKGL